jgi:DNA-binding NarL/FixJ family response regulator
MIADGRTNKEIAAEIILSEKTIKRTVSVILSKLNLERRAQAALFAGRRPPS